MPDEPINGENSRIPGNPLQSITRTIWGFPGTRIAGYFILLFVNLVVISKLLSEAGKLAHWKRLPSDVNELLVSVIEATAAFLSLWVFVRFFERRKMNEIGFQPRGIVSQTTVGYLIGMAAISTAFGLLSVLGAYHRTSVDHTFVFWLPLLVYLGAALFEEIVFRGFAQRVLEYRYGSLIALIVASLIFGLAHISNIVVLRLPFYQGLVGAVFIVLEAGPLLGAAYIATRRLWVSIGIHWAWNFFEGPIYGADVSGTTDPSFFHAKIAGPFWLTGGAFGPEASVPVMLVCTTIGLLLVRVAVRSGNWKPAGEWQPQSLPKS